MKTPSLMSPRNGAAPSETLVPSAMASLPAPRSSRPSLRMMEDRKLVRLLLWALIGVTVVFCIALAVVVSKMREPQLVHVIDAAGVIHSGPVTSLSASDGLFRHTALLASQAILSRTTGSSGQVSLDLPEYLDLLFLKEGKDQLIANVARDTPEFQAKALSQKPQVSEVTVVREKGTQRLVAVRGFLERTGVFQGRSYRENTPFSLVVSIVPNSRLDVAGAFPYVVSALDVKVNDAQASATTE